MKKNIAIIMGGYSSEMDISIKSGNVVYKYLNKEKYNVYKIHILLNKWVLIDENNNEFHVNKHNFSVCINDEIIKFDCIFNAIHGSPGEDGKILAYFDLIGIKCTSASFYQMALTFNKRDCLSVVKMYGIKTADSVYLNNGDNIIEEEIIKKVGLPCFVKPNKSGSSFGVSKVYKKENLKKAIEKAYKEDTEILIESFLKGKEVSIGVIEYKGKIKVLAPTEIVSSNDFFDYQAKYLGKSKEITPAIISEKQLNNLKKTAKKIYSILNMNGYSRSDFIFVGDEPYFIEINTVPGLTKASLLPQQAKYEGISLECLFESVIEQSLTTK